MPAKTRSTPRARRPDQLRFFLTFVLTIAVLYLGKAVIVPLALAILMAFILTPLVVSVQRRGLGRVPAVLLVLLVTMAIAAGVGWQVGSQVTKLADDLPSRAGAIQEKIRRIRSQGAGPFSRLIDSFEKAGDASQKQPAPGTVSEKPVVIEQPSTSPLERLSSIAVTVLEPIADAGLIVILVTFMLIKREDLRNRVVGLLGHGRLTGTTRVLVESADRISRLLLMQLCVNAAFGVIFGVLSLVIGVPYWFLWGFLTVLLRFIPYVGSWMAAALPVLLSFAISPGLSQPVLILAVFAALDLMTANVIEPLLFGHSTGVTPVALLVAAVFWTWVWGPIGLILSTPLTVCLVVLGQHVPQLRFLSLLMGDQPPLEPHVAFYQRLLAGDLAEAKLIAKQYATAHGWDHFPDGVVVPALRLARRDRKQSGLTADVESYIFQCTQEVIDSMPRTETAGSIGTMPAGRGFVLGCAAHHRAEELILQMAANVLLPDREMQVVSTRALPVEIETRVREERPSVVFIAIMPTGGVSQARHLCRRLRKNFSDLKIVVGYFGRLRDFDRLLTIMRASGASYVTTSVLQSCNQIKAVVPAEAARPVPGPVATPAESSVLTSHAT